MYISSSKYPYVQTNVRRKGDETFRHFVLRREPQGRNPPVSFPLDVPLDINILTGRTVIRRCTEVVGDRTHQVSWMVARAEALTG